eukprot:scaffold34809_cov69-Phaeocystis_antarctica.AAC.5
MALDMARSSELRRSEHTTRAPIASATRYESVVTFQPASQSIPAAGGWLAGRRQDSRAFSCSCPRAKAQCLCCRSALHWKNFCLKPRTRRVNLLTGDRKKRQRLPVKASVPVQLLKDSPSMVASGWLFSAVCTHVEPERPGIHITNGVVSRLGVQVNIFERLSACCSAPAEAEAAEPPMQKSQRRHLHHRLPRKGAGEQRNRRGGASGNASPVVVGLLLLAPVGAGDGVRVAVHVAVAGSLAQPPPAGFKPGCARGEHGG